MQDHGLGRLTDDQSDAKPQSAQRKSAAGAEEAPQPGEVLYEIGLMIAGFLDIALLAQLLVMAMQAG